MDVWQWIGVCVCLAHSATFSGLNLGFFGLSRLKLEVQAETDDPNAIRILKLRKDAHLLLATLLWGNVASNVLLTLLAESLLAGLGSFLFSTVGITFFGEIFPQAYLSRNMLKASIVLVPVVSFYRMLLYPIAKPTAMLLDRWLGEEKISYFKEKEIMILLHRHGLSDLSDVERLESLGAMNFLELDDTTLEEEGEVINPASIITLPISESGLPLFPDFDKSPEDPFLQLIHSSQEKWVIITNEDHHPVLVLNADQFLRDVLYEKDIKSMYLYCHRPIVVTEAGTTLGRVMLKLKVQVKHAEDDVVDNDLIIYWGQQKRIITGADILGRLLRGIAKRVESRFG